MSAETDRTDLLISILQDLTLAATDPLTEAGRQQRDYLLLQIQKLDHLCQPELVTDDSDLREPMPDVPLK